MNVQTQFEEMHPDKPRPHDHNYKTRYEIDQTPDHVHPHDWLAELRDRLAWQLLKPFVLLLFKFIFPLYIG